MYPVVAIATAVTVFRGCENDLGALEP